jgi:hypothetical protein
MANREQRSNREARKPKKSKAAPKAASPAPAPTQKSQPVAWKQHQPKPS